MRARRRVRVGCIVVVIAALAPLSGWAAQTPRLSLGRTLGVSVPAADKCVTIEGQVRCIHFPTQTVLCDLVVQAQFNGFIQNGIVSGTWSGIESSAACDVNMVYMYTRVDFTRLGALAPDQCSGSGLLKRPPVTCKYVQSGPGSFPCSNCNGAWTVHGHFDLIFPVVYAGQIAHGNGCTTKSATEVSCDLYATATLP